MDVHCLIIVWNFSGGMDVQTPSYEEIKFYVCQENLVDFRGPSALNLRQYVNHVDLYNLKLWSWYVYSLNGRALFDSWLYFLKGTECCLWSKNWGSLKLSGRSLTDGHWFLDWLITLNCDHNMFILSNGRALFAFWLQFLKGTGVADPRTEEIKFYCMPKTLIRELGGLSWTFGFKPQAMC